MCQGILLVREGRCAAGRTWWANIASLDRAEVPDETEPSPVRSSNSHVLGTAEMTGLDPLAIDVMA